ncbi:MAG: ABC transporter permease subunit [bacterium]
MNKQYLETLYALGKKELLSYFNSPIAYIFISGFLIIGNWLFFNSFFLIGQVSMRNYFSILPWMFLFLAPAITMRLWAEEKKSGTIEFLLTLPVTDWQVVLAKFLSALVFLSIALLLTLTIPFSISSYGSLDWGVIIGSYVGSIFMAGAYLSLGLFISALTKNQIIAFVIGLSACFGFFIVGADFVVMTAPKSLAPVMSFLGLSSHFGNISKGVIDSKDIIYYLSFIFIFLWLNAKVIANRSWK